MNELLISEANRQLQVRRVTLGCLKACPLCHAINAAVNKQCFSCSWGGDFDHDLETIQSGLDDLMNRCPELKLALNFNSRTKRRGFKSWFVSLFRPSRLDIRV
jgi:hypothetical protein